MKLRTHVIMQPYKVEVLRIKNSLDCMIKYFLRRKSEFRVKLTCRYELVRVAVNARCNAERNYRFYAFFCCSFCYDLKL